MLTEQEPRGRWGNAPAHQERHGLRSSPEYHVWLQIKQRCLNPRNKRYVYYGGRGIMMCVAWQKSFMAFYEHVGPRPRKGLMIDRLDNSKGYEPGNVGWRDCRTQQRNKRSNLWLEHQGQRKLLVVWAEELGMDRRTLRERIKRYGWSTERALTTPIVPSGKL